MKVDKEVVKNTVLTLTPNEASWLKCVMQNPLWVDHPDKEDSFDKEMRRKFFDALEWI